MNGPRNTIRPYLEGAEGAALLAFATLTWPIARHWLNDYGVGTDERWRVWPGDHLLPRVDACTTRAIAVAAPAAAIWPWLVQIGLGRGGFYSYEWLERIGGIDVHNATEVEPAWQHLAVGDRIVLHPDAPPLTVAVLAAGRDLCCRTWRDEADLAHRNPGSVGSWSLYVREDPEDSRRSRLILRSCRHLRRRSGATARFVERAFEAPLDFVMEQRLLRTVRRLAQRPPHAPVAA